MGMGNDLYQTRKAQLDHALGALAEAYRGHLRLAIQRENSAAQACAMEMKTFGDTKFTQQAYREARLHRMELEAN